MRRQNQEVRYTNDLYEHMDAELKRLRGVEQLADRFAKDKGRNDSRSASFLCLEDL